MAYYVQPIFISDYWKKEHNQDITFSQVEQYFNLQPTYLASLKKDKMNFIFKDKNINKFQAIKDYMYYVWELVNNVEQLYYRLEEDGYSVQFFSTWCHDNNFTDYPYQASEWINKNLFIPLEYNVEPYLRFDIRYIKPKGILQNILKGYEKFQQDIVYVNYNPVKVYITKNKQNKMVAESEINKYLENGWVRGKYQRTRTCPYCGITGSGSNMTRYHFDNCKKKDK